jgi:hypothetical protein
MEQSVGIVKNIWGDSKEQGEKSSCSFAQSKKWW